MLRFMYCYVECYYMVVCHYADCRYAESHGAHNANQKRLTRNTLAYFAPFLVTTKTFC
jgi:hypothetical protein